MGKFNNEGPRDRGKPRGAPRGRGGPKGRPGGARGGAKVFVQPHRLPGVYIARGPQDALVTKNLVPG